MRTSLLILLFAGLFNIDRATDELSNVKRIPVDFHIIPQQWRNLYSKEFYVIEDAIYAWISIFRPESFLDRIGSSPNQTTACERDLELLISAALQQELWALKVFDAWGKPLPSGLLNGNIFWLGNYEECINPLYQEQNRSFLPQPIDTQYCRRMFLRVIWLYLDTCFCSLGALQSVLSEPVEVRSGLTLGLCLPASCNRRTIIHLLHNVSELQN